MPPAAGRLSAGAKPKLLKIKKNRLQIIINEIPYQVNKSSLLEKIAELVKDKKIDAISEVRDESDRHGLRIVLELKKDETFGLLS